MKNILLFFLFAPLTSFINKVPRYHKPVLGNSENLIIITLDGFRWQEVFRGADSLLLNNTGYTEDTGTLKSLYWDSNKEERRKKLLPFFWNVIAAKGQLYGNRDEGSNVNNANIYGLSYPGYNEIFTGTTDLLIYDNRKKHNPNINVLEYLARQDEFKDKIAVFASWKLFPYILNQERNALTINIGKLDSKDPFSVISGNDLNNSDIECRDDRLTFMAARNYLQEHKPRILVIGLGGSDEYAHEGKYDQYLHQVNQFDHMISELWMMLQKSVHYRNKTTLMITTDHGRGRKDWANHGLFVNGSRETWLGLLGPTVVPIKEKDKPTQLYNKQFAGMMASLVGENFPR